MRVESQVRVRYELEGEVDKRLKKLQPCDWSGEGVACTDETCPDLFGPVGCDGFHKLA